MKLGTVINCYKATKTLKIFADIIAFLITSLSFLNPLILLISFISNFVFQFWDIFLVRVIFMSNTYYVSVIDIKISDNSKKLLSYFALFFFYFAELCNNNRFRKFRNIENIIYSSIVLIKFLFRCHSNVQVSILLSQSFYVCAIGTKTSLETQLCILN